MINNNIGCRFKIYQPTHRRINGFTKSLFFFSKPRRLRRAYRKNGHKNKRGLCNLKKNRQKIKFDGVIYYENMIKNGKLNNS